MFFLSPNHTTTICQTNFWLTTLKLWLGGDGSYCYCLKWGRRGVIWAGFGPATASWTPVTRNVWLLVSFHCFFMIFSKIVNWCNLRDWYCCECFRRLNNVYNFTIGSTSWLRAVLCLKLPFGEFLIHSTVQCNGRYFWLEKNTRLLFQNIVRICKNWGSFFRVKCFGKRTLKKTKSHHLYAIKLFRLR